MLSSLDPLFRGLYGLTRNQNVNPVDESRIKAGHSFEDATARLVYSHEKQCGLKAFPPRQIMNIPTRSGNSYQFDASFSHGDTTYVVECKRRQLSAAEHVPYFVSKVLDHSFAIRGRGARIRGIFLSSVEVGRNALQFGFAFGLRIITPSDPPLEEVYPLCKNNEAMKRAVKQLWMQLDSVDPLIDVTGPNPQTLLRSYEFLKRRVSNI